MIQIIIVIEFLLNPGLISPQRDHMSQKISYVNKKHVWDYETWHKLLPSKAPFIQILRLQIGGGVLLCADSADSADTGGGPNYETQLT